MITPVRGVVPPLCTAFAANGSVDQDGVAKITRHVIDGGVDGVFALGSSGEVIFQTRDMRRDTLTAVTAAAAGDVPVLAGVIGPTTLPVLEYVADALVIGVDGLVATAPFYTRTHEVEIEKHFRAIKEVAGDIPVYAYDIPACVHSKLGADLLLRLAEDGVIAGLKDSSGDDFGTRQVIMGKAERGLADFVVLTGSELLVDSAIYMGADGVVPGLGNVDPAGYARLYKLAKAGDLAGARAEQERLITLFGLVGVGGADRMGRGSSALGAFKAGMMLQGVLNNVRTVAPAVELNQSEIDEVATYLRQAGLLASA